MSSAYFLARAGHEVTVIDRQPGPGLETSFANGGQLSASHATPWANPSNLAKLRKWLGRDDAPLILHFRWDPAMWTWGMRFLANCTARRTRINTGRNLRVALYSRAVLNELMDDTGIDFDQRRRGILQIYHDARDFSRAVRQAALLGELGCRLEIRDPDGCVDVEPALSDAREKLAGGIYCPEDTSGDAYKFTARLAEICAGMGVVFRYDTPVKRLSVMAGRIAGVVTERGTVTADNYVLSLGSYSPLLLRPLSIRLPVYPAKGYSVTLPVTASHRAPVVSITDETRKLVYSRLGERLRVGGIVEFDRYNAELNTRRAEAILRSAMALFPEGGDASRAEFWAGLRPLTPDGVPVIGPSKFANLFLNTGHGTLGWTMGCGSGRIIADLVDTRTPDIDMEGLGLERF